MCNYKYKKEKGKKRAIGANCIYSKLTIPSEERTLCIPIDETGICIFHSDNIKWKKENNFKNHLEDLINYIKDYNLRKSKNVTFDFSEFSFVGDSQNKDAITISNIEFNKSLFISNAIFHANTTFSNCKMLEGVTIDNSIIVGSFMMIDSMAKGIDMSKTKIEDTFLITNTSITSYSLFIGTKFLNSLNFLNVDCTELVDFEDSEFYTKNNDLFFNIFRKTNFNDYLNFNNSKINSCLQFLEVQFLGGCNFNNTEFNAQTNSNYVSGSLDFADIEIGANSVMNFIGTDDKKLFNYEVSFSNELINGSIFFENANYNLIKERVRTRFHSLEKGKVVIGKGCLKYRFQSATKEIYIHESHQDLIFEIAKTYRNYFVVHNGLNLGLEIVERTSKKISYFFFSDEDITKEIFDMRLEDSFVDFWKLFSNIPQLSQSVSEQITSNEEEILPNKIMTLFFLGGNKKKTTFVEK